MNNFLSRRRLALCAIAALLFPLLAQAQAPAEAWPTRPVKLIVPFAAGGPTDTVARLIAQQLQAVWKQPVLIDYKPGAGTTLGTNVVAKSPADGYTLGMAISALTINPSLVPNMPYDTAGNNYVGRRGVKGFDDRWTLKMDQNVGSGHRLSGRYSNIPNYTTRYLLGTEWPKK